MKKRFMEACSVLEIKQVFTSQPVPVRTGYNNPKGNTDTESLPAGRQELSGRSVNSHHRLNSMKHSKNG